MKVEVVSVVVVSVVVVVIVCRCVMSFGVVLLKRSIEVFYGNCWGVSLVVDLKMVKF